MSFEEKLEQWREKTGQLRPPAELVRELEQAVAAPRPASSRAPVIVVGSVLLLLSVVGALAWRRQGAGADAPATERVSQLDVSTPALPGSVVQPDASTPAATRSANAQSNPLTPVSPGAVVYPDASTPAVPRAVNAQADPLTPELAGQRDASTPAVPRPANAQADPLTPELPRPVAQPDTSTPVAPPVRLVAPVVPASATRPPARELERVLSPPVAPCPPKPEGPQYAAPVPNDLYARAAALRPLLESAPLTCEAQLEAIEMVSAHGSPTARELLALDARRAYLCGLGQTAWPTRAPAWRPRPPAGGVGRCDPALWCRVPDCDVKTEACQRALDAQPLWACEVLEARRRLFDLACVRLLQGALTQQEAEAEFARLNTRLVDFGVKVVRPWCLAPAARAEAKVLLERGAKPASP